MRTASEVRTRALLIRKATPDVLEKIFEMQNRLCDLCGQPIQDLILAALDHSTPVVVFARGPLPIEEASRQCNAPENLRAVHSWCNSSKHDMTRSEWFERGLDKTQGQRTYTPEELEAFRVRLGAGGRTGAGGRIGGKISGRITAEKGIGCHTREHRSKGGCIGGKIGGRVVGCKNKEQRRGIFAPGMSAKGSRIGGKIGGRKTKEQGLGIFAPGMSATGARAVNHNRWHVRRGLVPEGTAVVDCPACKAAKKKRLAKFDWLAWMNEKKAA